MSTDTVAVDAAAEDTPIRVYLLDDHELLRRALVSFLHSVGGFSVVGESGTAGEAVRRIPALRPDVALIDIRLPDGSGVEVCRHVRSRDPAIKVLMITSFDDDEARLASFGAGASGVVLKDIYSDDLCRTVRRVAAGETLPAPATDAQESPRPSATRPGDPRVAALTGQEQRILVLLGEGLSNRQIAERLTIGEKTVKNYVSSILHKMGFERRTQAAVFAVTTE